MEAAVNSNGLRKTQGGSRCSRLRRITQDALRSTETESTNGKFSQRMFHLPKPSRNDCSDSWVLLTYGVKGEIVPKRQASIRPL